MPMKKHPAFLMCLLLCELVSGPYVWAGEQEGVVYDSISGNYVVTYRSGYSGKLNTVVFVPATKIVPILKSRFKWSNGKNFVLYEYKIRNGPNAHQNIDMLYSVSSSIAPNSSKAPKNWDINLVHDQTDLGTKLSWTYRGAEDLGGLPPGSGLMGFAVESVDMPGIATMRFTGARPVIEWLGHFPAGSVGEQVDRIVENDFVSRPAAVPKIPVSDPFDAGVVLANLQKHLKDDIVSMQLIDPVFATQLDRYLQGAIDAAKAGNTTGVKGNLKDFRRLLKSEHDDPGKDDDWDKDDDDKSKDKPKKLIDKLAARVLDFDAKYVLKRLGEDD